MKNQGFVPVSGLLSSVIVGAVFSFLFIFAVSFIPAFLIRYDLLSISYIKTVSIVILAVGSMLGAYRATMRYGCNGMFVGILVGLFDLLIIFLLGVVFQTVFFDIINISLFFVKFFSLVLFGAIGGILSVNMK